MPDSPITYPGGKNFLKKWIIGHFPQDYGVYVEPFGGGGFCPFMETPLYS